MNNYNPFFNSLNMTRSISPFATTASSFISNATQGARSTGLLSKLSTSKFSLSGILNGAQKTIGTVNQIVPLYNQIKPMVQNSKVLLNVAKSLKSTDNSTNSRGLFPKRRNRPMYNQQHSNIVEQEKETIKKEEKFIENTPSKPFFI